MEARESFCPPNVWLRGEFGREDIGTERRLLCGDQDGQGPSAEAWRNIPDSQVQFHFRTFCRSARFLRGQGGAYGGPSLARLGSDDPGDGPPTCGRGSSELRLERRRKIVGQALTPLLLDEVERWIRDRLQFEGFACPQVRAEANPKTGEIVAKVVPGLRQDLISIIERSNGGLGA